MFSKKVEIDLLFETSWEVCNKVGGIYTVLSTKAKNLQTLYKDKVIFIGPDVWTEDNPCKEFTESKTILKSWKENVLLPEGVSVRVGRWNVPGKPIAVLVKFDGLYAVKDAFYAEMWQKFGVDSLHGYGDYDEANAFSRAAGQVIESIVKSKKLEKGSRVIAHFDEWTTGMGLLYVKDVLPEVATIFTTHATSIGRSICGNGKPLYDYFKGYNGDQMARELNMESKHSLEKAAAHNADCFTTVSDITADECEQLLDLRPNVVTPNGFEENFVPGPRIFNSTRKKARKTLLEIANALTGAGLDEDTFIVATSGRCEYRNKGLDLFIDSVGRLGQLDSKRRILAYVMVPAWVAGPRADLSHNLSLSQNGHLSNAFVTHNLNNFEEDAVVRHLRAANFANDSSSRVVTIYVPCYLSGNDGIFNKSYYDLLIGMDATVFPSYYEPWGYTPLESVAFGVPTVTTSLSGFGRWILSNFENSLAATGVMVVPRGDSDYDSTRDAIASTLRTLSAADKETKENISVAARQTAKAAAWDYFIDYYVMAFDLAFARRTERTRHNK